MSDNLDERFCGAESEGNNEMRESIARSKAVIDQHKPGAKLDAGKNRLGLVLFGFSGALEAVGQVGTFGANKYSDNGWLEVEDGKGRYSDAMLRHLMAHARGEINDPESGLPHLSHFAWNALAILELELRS